MANARKVLLVVAALVFVALGFLVGQIAQAAISLPGSDEDPVVTQSYVEQLVSERTASLRTQIDELQQQIDILSGNGGSTVANNSSSSDNSGDGNTSGNSASGTTGSNDNSGSVSSSDLPSKVTVTGNTVNIRASASTDSSKVGSAKKGDVLTVTAKSGNWYKVKLADGTVGYIRSDLVEVK